MTGPIVPLDWHGMFLGDGAPLFHVEIMIRTCVIHTYALIVIRWIGGRGIAQMSVVEFLLVVAFGSTVGDAMFHPEVPLFHALLVITIVCVANKLIDVGMMRSAAFRRVMAGEPVRLIRHGRIDLHALNPRQGQPARAVRGVAAKRDRQSGPGAGRVSGAFGQAECVQGNRGGHGVAPCARLGSGPAITTARPDHARNAGRSCSAPARNARPAAHLTGPTRPARVRMVRLRSSRDLAGGERIDRPCVCGSDRSNRKRIRP